MRDVIVIPTYNERENIQKLLRTIFEFFPNVHVLVVDDSSPDQTANEVQRLQEEIANLHLLVRSKKEGLGRAYIAAFRKILSEGGVIRAVCTMDADFAHSAKYLEEMFAGIKQADVVVGSRYVSGGNAGHYPFPRNLVSLFARFYYWTLFNLPVRDGTSGFMCIRASLLRQIDFEQISSSGYAFLVELKCLLQRKGAVFSEFPIILGNRERGESKIGLRAILEGILSPWRFILTRYALILKKFFAVSRDSIKRRGIFFLARHGLQVLYSTRLKERAGFFEFRGNKYQYFYHIYNATCLNERAVEVPIAWEMVREYQDKEILEVGNVLGHYFSCTHDVLDKYEQSFGVINQDVVDFRAPHQYDLIVSVSTLEHVGFDEEQKDPQKIVSALNNLRGNLSPGGKMLITLCLGYNLAMDKLLADGALRFDRLYFLKRDSGKNEWREVGQGEALSLPYDYSLWTARGLAIGVIEN